MDALNREEARIESSVVGKDYKNENYRVFSYKSRGRYLEQIKRYSKFYSSNQLKVICSESLFRNPRKVLKELFLFLGIDDSVEIKDLSAKNIAQIKPKVDHEAVQYLTEYFKQYNKELFEYLNEQYEWR